MKLNKTLERTIVRLAKDHTYNEISEIEGVSISTINRVLTNHGKLKRVTKYGANRTKFEKMYKKLGSIKKVSEKTGETYGKVYYYLTKK